jgi:serine/arginine repetitive matrix protein 2
MLGGGHVRRRSIDSSFGASPCVRFEKKKHAGSRPELDLLITEKPSIKFGGERMIKAQRGLLARESLEECCLVADGEDVTSCESDDTLDVFCDSLSISSALSMPVFSRPSPAARSRASTCTTSSSGADTPPLSCSDGSSQSDDSRSSIDLSHLDTSLINFTHPVTTGARARARVRGNGHRRRVSQACPAVYETIEEERSNPPTPAAASAVAIKKTDCCDDVCAVDSIWDDEQGILVLRKYYALRDP